MKPNTMFLNRLSFLLLFRITIFQKQFPFSLNTETKTGVKKDTQFTRREKFRIVFLQLQKNRRTQIQEKEMLLMWPK